jgi:aerobic-type carbon monoxide dehydrogenase small subunit (CoxS/CutS family)
MSAGIRRAAPVAFSFDGQRFEAPAGESVAAALWQAGIRHLRDAPAGESPRGMFCCMGLCQECVVLVGGTPVESCRLPVSEGLTVTSLRRRR